MRVLVTGHHGYLGSVVAPFLAEAGHDVEGLDTFFYEGCDLTADRRPVPGRRLDLRDVVPSDLEGLDAVVHLGALSNDPLGDLDPALTFAINLDASVALARAAREAGVERFVFASSCSMYGASGTAGPLDEAAPLVPLTPYAESKVRAEPEVLALADDGFTPVSLRNATVYGVSPRLRVDIVLNNLVAWAHTTGTVRLLSDGSAWRPLVHVEDVARAVQAVLEAPPDVVAGEAFNVGSDADNYRVRELAEIVRDTVPGSTVELGEGAGSDPRSYRVDFSKFAGAFPEHVARWTAPAGARELYDAYREAGLTLERFQGDAFVRLAHLRLLLGQRRLDDDLRWRG
jgi:nucleoside-diphosphate-sugar epimerase